MTTHDALLRSVIESPGDDLPRLVMADFLEESGEVDRSSFIRVQVELARLGTEDISESPINPYHRRIDSRKSELRCRERELRDSHEREWLPDPAMWEIVRVGVGGRLRIQREWHRGFISSITCDWQTFLRVADALIWYSGQTVECPKCRNGWIEIAWNRPDRPCQACRDEDKGNWLTHGGTGRIPRPFVPTAQPITKVTLSSWPLVTREPRGIEIGYLIADTGERFDRVKCPKCDGLGVQMVDGMMGRRLLRNPCPDCHGTPPNLWHCDRWPGIVFVMPENR